MDIVRKISLTNVNVGDLHTFAVKLIHETLVTLFAAENSPHVIDPQIEERDEPGSSLRKRLHLAVRYTLDGAERGSVAAEIDFERQAKRGPWVVLPNREHANGYYRIFIDHQAYVAEYKYLGVNGSGGLEIGVSGPL